MVDGRHANTKISSEIAKAGITVCVPAANLPYLRFVQDRSSISGFTSLSDHVVNVVLLRSSKDVIRSYARLLFLDMVDPQPEPEAPKKAGKKRGPRSSRASGMAAAIKDSLEQGKQAAAAVPTGEVDGPKCGICGNPEDYQDHFRPSPNFHEFEGPKSKKAAK